MMRPTSRLRRLGVVALVAIGATVVLALGAEVALRLEPALLPEDARLRLFWRATHDAVPKVADPHLGFTHPPNDQGEVEHEEFSFSYTTDARGFRNDGPWPRTADVVVLGDSQTFGFGVDDGKGWVARLDEALGEARVVNLGINGTAPLQQLLVFETHGSEVQPKTVVFSLFPGQALGAAAEFQAWLDAGRPPSFLDFRERTGEAPLWKRLAYWAMDRSHLVLFLRSVADGLRTPYPGFTAEIDGGRISFTPYIWAGHAATGRPGEERFELVLEAVEQVRAAAEGAGARFLVVLFPTKEEVYLPLFERPVPDLTPPFARALRARGIPVVDLLPVFRARAAEGERLFLEVDIHPNEDGYALVAEAVAERLEATPRRLARNNRP